MKYGDQSVRVVVAAAATLECVLRWPDRMCRNVPALFAEIGEQDLRRLSPQPGVISRHCCFRCFDCVTMARSVVPDLKGIIVIGDDWGRQIVCGTLDVAAGYAVIGSADLR
jgi:hypothetical protein